MHVVGPFSSMIDFSELENFVVLRLVLLPCELFGVTNSWTTISNDHCYTFVMASVPWAGKEIEEVHVWIAQFEAAPCGAPTGLSEVEHQLWSQGLVGHQFQTELDDLEIAGDLRASIKFEVMEPNDIDAFRFCVLDTISITAAKLEPTRKLGLKPHTQTSGKNWRC